MAYIDDLLDQMEDGDLKERLLGAVDALRKGKKFGLVFEEHVPETTLLRSLGVKVGTTVTRRNDPKDPNCQKRYKVVGVKGDKVTVAPTVEDDGKPSADVVADKSLEQVLDVSDLLVVQRFDDFVYPVLTQVGAERRGGDKPSHTILDGENFHALQLLMFQHRGQVDCIYIDPPYNTGDAAGSWKYNNRFVDDNDTWRHSKWLSFMEKRLKLARELLRSDGVLVVTIDENEVHHLGVLLEELFPNALRQMVTIVINPSGASGDGLSRVEEYAYFCFLGGSLPQRMEDDLLTVQKAGGRKIRWESLMRGGAAWYRKERENLCYPILLDPKTHHIVGAGDPFDGAKDESTRQTKFGKLLAAWPVRDDGKLGIWRVEASTLKTLAAQGYAYTSSANPERGTWTIRYLMSGTIKAIEAGDIIHDGELPSGQANLRLSSSLTTVPKTVWYRGRYTAGGSGGTYLVSALLGEKGQFTYPKSIYAVADTLSVAIGDRKNALILDFFAGSGTTLHATALLNAGDGGSRRCIIATNNELSVAAETRLRKDGHFPGDPEWEAEGVFENVTWPRVRAAITGKLPNKKPVPGNYLDGTPIAEGLEENVAAFRLDYVHRTDIALRRAFQAVLPVLWMAAGARGDHSKLKVGPQMVINKDSPFAVLLNEDHIAEFLVKLKERSDITHVWLVTDSPKAFARMKSLIPGKPAVGMLYRDFLRNFEMSVRIAK